ncbi:hypothetical protein [Streptomyces griseiscabiei]|uniref:Uncharacterized protein n=1 Tax=Streptomyces griseiscabiei TaxID=2993540 RepID=A0ABU4L2L1_9ACTN|nr:hypothetical protein [Streptomyces griseiscabiei]MBZ3901463.1 hypothetical protein [Streptomyces griseiscabiei]MDX2909987.1 hypothetical protein [Streptomyces griseiscabiei]
MPLTVSTYRCTPFGASYAEATDRGCGAHGGGKLPSRMPLCSPFFHALPG